MKRSLLFLLLFFATLPARAELTGKQIALIAMAESVESRELAKYYAKARGVPESQILLLEGRPIRTISRLTWETKTRPAIRKWLADNQWEANIHCFVTCWDVPLKIGRRDANSPEVVERQNFLTNSREVRVKQFDGLISLLESLGRGDKPEPGKPMAADVSLRDVAARLDSAVATARSQIMAIPDNTKRLEASRRFDQIFMVIGGGGQILRMAAAGARKSPIAPEQAMRLEVLKARTQGLQHGIQALSMLPATVPRDAQLLNLIRLNDGLLGSLRWIDKQQEELKKNETYSSFDSELSLLRWNDYPLYRWQPNLLFHGYGAPEISSSSVVMVSRSCIF